MHPLDRINNWFRNLNIRKKLAVYTAIMSIFLLLNGLIGFFIGHTPLSYISGILIIFGVSALVIFIVIPFVVFIIGTIRKPIQIIANRMKEVASGNLNLPYAKISTVDELGEVNNAFDLMANNLRNSINKERITREREEFLRGIILTSITTLQTNQVLKTVVIETGKRFNAARCYFIRYDDKNKKFLPIQDYEIYLSSIEHKDLTGKLLKQEELDPFLKILIGQRQEIIISDVSKFDLPESTKQFLEQYSIRAFIAAPVSFQNRPIGILMADFNSTDRQFSEEEIEIFTSIANQSAIVFHQTQLFHETQVARDRADKLRKIISTFTGALDINETLQNISSEIAEIYQADRVTISEFPDKQDFSKFIIRSEYTASISIIPTDRAELDPAGLIYWGDFIFNKGQILVIDNVSEADIPELLRYNLTILGSEAIIGIPIRRVEDIWGSITIALSHPKHWSEEEISLLPSISDQMYLAIRQSELFTSTRKLANREATLRRVISTFTGTADINETLQNISKELFEIFGADRINFVEFPDKNNLSKWIVRADYVASPNMRPMNELDLDPTGGQYWGDFLFNKGRVLAIDNVSQYEMADPLKNNLKLLGIKSVMGIPIRRGEDIWGSITIGYIRPKHFTADEKSLLQPISEQIYLAIKQADLYSTANENAEREELLRKIIEAIRSTLDISDLKKIISSEIGRSLNADRCGIFEYDSKTHKFLHMDDSSQYVSSPEIRSYTGIDLEEENLHSFRDWLLSGKDLFVPDTNKLPEDTSPLMKNFYEQEGIKSNYSILITYRGETLGFLYLNYIKQKREFSEDDLTLLSSLSDQAAVAIYQARIYNNVQKTAERESLLREIISTVRNTLDINDIEQGIVNKVGKAFGADRCFFRVYDRDNDKFLPVRVQYRSSPDVPDIIGATFPESRYGGFKRRYQHREIHAYPDLEQLLNDPNFDQAGIRALIEDYDVKSNYGISIFYEDKFLGVFVLHYTKRKVSLDEDFIELMKSIADQAGIALNQADLYSLSQRSAERERILRTINNQILSSHNLDEAVSAIVEETGRIFNVDRVALRFYEPANRSFSEVRGEYRKNETIPVAYGKPPYTKEVSEYFIREVADKRQILSIENIDDPKYPNYLRDTFKYLNIKSTLLSTIMYSDTILGIIFLTDTNNQRIWNKQEINLLQDITSQISIAMHLFDLTNRLSHSLDSERTVREIIFEAREQENHDLVFDYMLQKLIDLFKIERAIHLHYDEHRNLTVKNERLSDTSFESMCNKPVLLAKQTGELEPKVYGETVIVNDVDSEIHDIKLKDYLKGKNILSFIIYPKARPLSGEQPDKITAIVMLCSSRPRIWTQNEINSFRLITDATSLVYLELRQRKETEETRNTFLATLTHDLRSPLFAEQKSLEIILSKRLGTNLDNFAEYLGDMYKTNEELLRIVNNILSVYHYEEGKFELKLEGVNISDLISTSVSVMKPLAEDQGSKISTHIEQDLPKVMVDRNEILRVINNLVSNAIKHNTRGTTINVSAKRVNGEVQVCIKDNGKGIPESERGNIFQRYPTTKRKIGTGLGLYLSKQIVDAHLGKIWFDSEVNKGTTFCFTIPVS